MPAWPWCQELPAPHQPHGTEDLGAPGRAAGSWSILGHTEELGAHRGAGSTLRSWGHTEQGWQQQFSSEAASCSCHPMCLMKWTLKGHAFFQGCFCTWALEMFFSKSLLSNLNLLVPQFPIGKARLIPFPVPGLPGELISPAGPGKPVDMDFCLPGTVGPGLIRD